MFISDSDDQYFTMAQTKVTDDGGDLTEETRNKIKHMFRVMDRNGNGRIGTNEVIRGAQLLNINICRQEAEHMIRESDKDGSGCLEYKEFEEMMKIYLLALEYQDEIMRDAFKRFDKDGNGTLDKMELKSVLCSMGESLTEKEADEMFDLVDEDRNGKINIDEFVNAFKAS